MLPSEHIEWSPAKWNNIVANQRRAKRVHKTVYVHVDCASKGLQPYIDLARRIAGLEKPDFSLVKMEGNSSKVSLLDYPGLGKDAFPYLRRSWLVDLKAQTAQQREYDPDANPPVLHRQEQLLPANHPNLEALSQLTQEAEEAGLFDDSWIIGRRLQWEEELRAKGLALKGLCLVQGDVEPTVLRHRTALTRRTLSSPVAALWRHGIFDGQYRFFDYGCGKGDDMALLGEKGVATAGWDPHFLPEGQKLPAEVVNLGFVLNVIENPVERREALEGAWKLTEEVLSVAALIGGRTAFEKHRLYSDGVLTSIGTF
ncbi:MAG: DNA phosphorothioation-associated putative methyltransferase, partial [Proteobacteria bacterium]|nr:DNA phosphorothioation-associated putative methyltransferase [Pseudomonadota bacterium]